MRIAITSREQLFLDALVCLFGDTRFNVVSADGDSRKSIVEARTERADVLIMDLKGSTDQDLQFLLGAQAFGDFETVLIKDQGQDLPAGFTLAVDRTDSSERLVEKIHGLASTQTPRLEVRGRGIPRMMTNGLELSSREYEAAKLIAKGYTNLKIAEILQLKEQSVKNLVSTIIRKLRCENRVQVALHLNNLSRTTPG